MQAAFGPDGAAKLVLHGVYKENFEESFRLNADPKFEKLLPDNWAVNESWALHVAVLWPMPNSTMSCDQQIAIERGDYDDEDDTKHEQKCDKKNYDQQKWVDYIERGHQQDDQHQDESSRETDKSYETVERGFVATSSRGRR